jgi:hypothetical protein
MKPQYEFLLQIKCSFFTITITRSHRHVHDKQTHLIKARVVVYVHTRSLCTYVWWKSGSGNTTLQPELQPHSLIDSLTILVQDVRQAFHFFHIFLIILECGKMFSLSTRSLRLDPVQSS